MSQNSRPLAVFTYFEATRWFVASLSVSRSCRVSGGVFLARHPCCATDLLLRTDFRGCAFVGSHRIRHLRRPAASTQANGYVKLAFLTNSSAFPVPPDRSEALPRTGKPSAISSRSNDLLSSSWALFCYRKSATLFDKGAAGLTELDASSGFLWSEYVDELSSDINYGALSIG